MRWIVTGGAGFIGSNIVDSMPDDEIIVVDNLHTGVKGNIKKDVTVYSNIQDVPKEEYDGIFHLGIPSSTPMYRKDRSLVASAITDFVNLMELALELDLPVVYASSSSVYNGLPVPNKEDMIIEPTDFYTEVRVASERLARVYNEFYGLKSSGMRLFSVYGPFEDSKKYYANLISQAIWAGETGNDFEIYGDGEQTRDFTYVEDTVSACKLAMEKMREGRVSCEIFNVGTGVETSINDMVKEVKNYLPLTVKYVDNKLKNYVQRTCADTTKTQKLLGFEASVSLTEGITRCIEARKQRQST